MSLRVTDSTSIIFHRARVARLCVLAGVLLMVLSAYVLRPGWSTGTPDAVSTPDQLIIIHNAARRFPPGDSLGEAAVLMVFGGALLWTGLALADRRWWMLSGLPSDLPYRALRPGRIRWRGLVLGGLALLLLADANGERSGLDVITGLPSHVQFALLVIGAGLVAWGLASPPGPLSIQNGEGEYRLRALDFPSLTGLERRDKRRKRVAGSPLSPSLMGKGGLGDRGRFEVIWLALITLLAFALRVWDLNGSIHTFVDELNFANTVRWFAEVPDHDILPPMTGIVAFPRIYAYLEWLTTDLLGRNLSGLRLVSAVIGTLTIPAVYLLGRTLFDRWTGLIAAALLAAFPPHLHYSRLGLNNIADPLVGTLAFAFLASGMRTGRRRDYALAGVMLGLTQYFYEAGRVVFPGVMVGWIIALMLIGRRRPSWRGSAITVLAAILIAAPVYYSLAGRDQPVLARTNVMLHPTDYWVDLLISSPEDAAFTEHLDAIRDTFLIYIHQPEASYFYGGEQALVLPVIVPLLLIGAAFALGRLRTPGPLLLVGWIVAVSMGNSFMVQNTDSPRYVAAFPALMLLSAVGLRVVVGLLWPDRPDSVGAALAPPGSQNRARQAAPLLVVLLLLAITGVQIHYYFGPHLDMFNKHHRLVKPYPDGEDALFRSVDFPPGTHIHLVSESVYDENYARDVLKFLVPESRRLEVDTLSPLDISWGYWLDLRRDVDHAFFIEHTYTAIMDDLPPSIQVEPPRTSPYGIHPAREFVLYYIPAPQPGEVIR